MPEKNKFIYGRPVQGREFINRVDELLTIFSRLRNRESSAITGPAHIGKSSILINLMDTNTQKQFLGETEIDKLIFSFIDLLSVDIDYSPEVFWQDALEPIKEKVINNKKIVKAIEQTIKGEYKSRELRNLFNLLSEADFHLVLLLDEFERLLNHPNFEDLSFFGTLRNLSTVSGGLSMTITSRLSVSQMDQITSRSGRQLGSPFFNNMIQITLKPFSDAVIDDWLAKKIDTFTTEELEFIKRVAGPTPYLLQAMVSSTHFIYQR